MQNIVLATKKYEDEWRGTLIVDNQFREILVDYSLADLVGEAVRTLSAVEHEFSRGQEVIVEINIKPLRGQNGPTPTA